MLFKHHPTYWMGGIRAVIALLLAAKVVALTPEQTGAVLALSSAVIAVAIALAVKPFAWPLMTGFAQAAISLVLAFGFTLSEAQISAALAIVAFLVAGLDHSQVIPETKLPAIVAVAA